MMTPEQIDEIVRMYLDDRPLKEIAEVFGVNEPAIGRILRIQRGLGRDIPSRGAAACGQHQKVPVEIRGVAFASAADAARHFGLTVEAVLSARRRGTLDRLGLEKKNLALTLSVNGVKFRSVRAAAQHIGITNRALCNLQGFDIVWDKEPKA